MITVSRWQKIHQSPKMRVLQLVRLTLLFGMGVLAGYLWLSPVFVPPGSAPLYEPTQTLERSLRVLPVLLVLPFVLNRAVRMIFRERILKLLLWVFMGAPLFSILNLPERYFLIATLGPFVIGGMSIVCLCALNKKEFYTWIQGVGATATVFLGIGLAKYGLEMLNYTGHLRAHYGFIHPIQSASAVTIAGMLLTLWAHRMFRRLFLAKWLAVGTICIAFSFLLYLVMSRNFLLSLIAILAFSGFAMRVHSSVFRYAVIIIILMLVFTIYAISIWGGMHQEYWNMADQFSSGRMYLYHDMVKILNKDRVLSILIGPSEYTQYQRWRGFGGFSVIESVYLSVYANFGLVTLVSLLVLFLSLGWRLSLANLPLAYGCFCAIMILFAVDAQGITPSNLAIFLLLVYVVRNALSVRERSGVISYYGVRLRK